MKKPSGMWVLGVLCAVVSGCGVEATYASSAPSAPGTSTAGTVDTTVAPPSAAALDSELQRVRDATAAYTDPTRARADGYAPPTGACSNADQGTAGIAYVSLSLMATHPDLDHPAGLLYVPDGDQMRLVGVKYIVPVMVGGTMYTGAATPTEDPAVRPSLLGQDFTGPLPGEGPGMPWHYELYAWVWQHNPAGTFSPWNPSLTCQ